ncbi:hypothetical protein [Pseudomonas sp. CCC4.4]|uniref:hypothetical protein n=1 Tax=Pseudomonas sp. CCC4.4 TaxID=3048612 RepID=UPI002B22C6F5|nr:hypothetical protein [Pseudomonas sp. CCC4.4]MEB0170066.1 hypothetical protein [Pseudomonas sp. CCC4.4]
MSEVKRYDIDFARGHSIFSDTGVFVLSSDYDAALAKIAALQLLLNTADQRNAEAIDLMLTASAVIDDGYPVKAQLREFINAGRADVNGPVAGSEL